jgi:hypothetical protein
MDASIDTTIEDLPTPGEVVEDPGSATWMVAAAGVSVAVSILLFVSVDNVALQVVGYVLACLVPFTLIALYRRSATRRMFAVGIGQSTTVNAAGGAILVAGLLSTIGHAWFIARHYY